MATKVAQSAVFARWPFFAALIAAAGLPISTHTPTLSAETYGIGLALLCLIGSIRDPRSAAFAAPRPNLARIAR
jgi:hypothetical protein